MQSSIRVAVALAAGVAVATLVPIFRPLIPLWILRVAIFSVATWWLLPRIIPGQRRASGLSKRKPIDISAEAIEHGRQWFVVQTRPAPLPKSLIPLGMFFGFLFACVAIIMSPTQSAFVGDGMSHFMVFLLIGMPAGVWTMRWFGNVARKLPVGPFAVSSDAMRLPDGTVVPRDRIHQIVIQRVKAGSNSGNLAEVSYGVCIEHDGISSTLASGLSQPQANGVFVEVKRRMPGFG